MGRVNSLEVLAGLEPAERDRDRAPAHRDRLERLRGRAELLADEDRILLKMYLETGSSFHQLARLVGLNRSTLCRRIHRMIHRLSDETFAACLRNAWQFSPRELDIIRDHFVRGQSLARICRSYHLAYYRVRVIVEKARTFARAQDQAP